MNIKIFCRCACVFRGQVKDLSAPLYNQSTDDSRSRKERTQK